MAAESEQADESGVLPISDSSPATADADEAGDADGAHGADGAAEAETSAEAVDLAESAAPTDAAAEATLGAVPEATSEAAAEAAPEDGEVRPEDVREGVVDLVAYAVGAVALILLGYFTQRDVLTWTRGPFTVVVIIMAVHWAGRRVQARRDKVGGAR